MMHSTRIGQVRNKTTEDRDTLAKESVTAFQTKTHKKDSVMTQSTTHPADVLEVPTGFILSKERETMAGRPVFDGPGIELADCDASVWSDWTEDSGVRVTLNNERPPALHELAEVHGAVGAILARIQRSVTTQDGPTTATKPLHAEATPKYIDQLIQHFQLTTT